MRTERMNELPRLPISEVEWEDLLVRFEVMPRALRFVLEGLDAESAQVRLILASLLEREEWAGGLLESAARPENLAPVPPRDPQILEGTGLTMDRFIRTRARNFAMLQRRGVDVWEWVVRAEEISEATAYQLLTFLVRSDVIALAALRAAGRRGAPSC
jgi:hypothetical protein